MEAIKARRQQELEQMVQYELQLNKYPLSRFENAGVGCYALCGTELSYAALLAAEWCPLGNGLRRRLSSTTRCAVLSSAMVVPGSRGSARGAGGAGATYSYAMSGTEIAYGCTRLLCDV
eukprot:240634-Rhodomonas_salina.1